MTTCLGKSCSFCLPRVPFVNCRQFMYLVISLLVLRAGYGIWLYQFLIIAYLFTLLLTSKVCPQGVVCPSPGAIYIYEIIKNVYKVRFRFLNLQRMGKVIRAFCWHQRFFPRELSVPALGLYTCIKSFKMCLKSYFKEIVLKDATNWQSNKGFLLASTFVLKGLSAPALGLYTCIKALKYIPGPGVSWAFTGPLVLWFLFSKTGYLFMKINDEHE